MGRRGKKRSSGGVKPLSKPASRGRGQPTHGGGASKPPAGGLFVVATPIGNSADITLRALDALRDADVIACEDTRITTRLLAIHNIGTALVPYHDHNAVQMLPVLIKRLKKGEMVALVSDAGTPLISDPGYRLVRKCIEDGLAVTALPGASAVLPALVLSGLPTDRFLFAGFPPPRPAARKRTLESLAVVPATLVFLESARRLAASLADMAEVLGDRQAAVCREMTKMFEEARRGTLPELAAHYALAGPPRGEVTVVVAPPGERPPDPDEVDRLLGLAMAEGTLRDAAARVAAATGVPRRRVYARALELKRRRP
jgi:16S rRNA (cytidine1402-2'-O)-methyltransferase